MEKNKNTRSKKDILNKVWNNPEADKMYMDNPDLSKDYNMLYDENSKSNKRIELIKRMVRGHNRNIDKIGKAPKATPLSAAEKRARKLEDLLSRWNSWKNLR